MVGGCHCCARNRPSLRCQPWPISCFFHAPLGTALPLFHDPTSLSAATGRPEEVPPGVVQRATAGTAWVVATRHQAESPMGGGRRVVDRSNGQPTLRTISGHEPLSRGRFPSLKSHPARTAPAAGPSGDPGTIMPSAWPRCQHEHPGPCRLDRPVDGGLSGRKPSTGPAFPRDSARAVP